MFFHHKYYLLFILIFVIILTFFHFRGMIYNDEGYMVNISLRIMQGQVPYRDFDLVYTPIPFLTTASFFKLFGVSIMAERIVALCISYLSLFAIYKILTLIKIRTPIIIICLLFFIAWGPAHINFSWPIVFVMCFFFYALYFYLLGKLHHKKYSFFLSGIMTILIFLSKQNFGLTMVSGYILSLLTLPRNKKLYSIYFVLGLLCAVIITLIIFQSTQSFVPFIHNLYTYTIEQYLLNKALDTPFLYPGSLFSKLAKLLFYLSPLLFSAGATITLLKKGKTNLIIIPIFTALFFLTGIRPTTDYVHVVGLIAVSGLSLAIMTNFAPSPFTKKIAYSLFIGMTLFGFITAYFTGYYRWYTPLAYQNTYDNHPRIRVFVTGEQQQLTKELSQYLQKTTSPHEYIFVNTFAPAIYFFSDRKNATKQDVTTSLSTLSQNEIIKNLQKKM